MKKIIFIFLFCLCFISCNNKKVNVTEPETEAKNNEQTIEQKVEPQISQNNTIDYFQGVNIFSTTVDGRLLYEFENQEYYFRAYWYEQVFRPLRFSFLEGIFYMEIPELDIGKIDTDGSIKEIIKGEYTIKSENGFVYILAADKKFLVLHNGALICILIDCDNNDAFFGLNKDSQFVHVREKTWPYVGITGKGGWDRDHKVSSFLTETIGGRTIEYDGSNENYYFELTKPWVEGADGHGIGEWIETMPLGDVCGIIFFNGYIDPNRPDLYYANSRIKEVLVTTPQNSWSFHIKDTPNPQILPLPRGFNDSLRFTIMDVYEGDRYTDTCLAGIYYLNEMGQ